MEQVEGGDLVVNRGNESKPKEGGDKRDLNAVEGYEAAIKLSQACFSPFTRPKLPLISQLHRLTSKNSSNQTTNRKQNNPNRLL